MGRKSKEFVAVVKPTIIKEFDSTKFDDPANKSCIALIGKRNAGKSTCMVDLIFNMRESVDVCIVFSETDSANPTFSHIIPDTYIYSHVTDEILENAIKRQELLIANPPDGVRTDTKFLIVFDDCMTDKKAVSTAAFQKLFTQGRHLNFVILVAVQYVKSLVPVCRNNCDYIFISQENIPKQRDKLYEEFFGIFGKKQLFYKAMDHFTPKFGMLVMDNRSRSTEISDVIFWYKAVHLELDFKIGNEEYWQFHNQYYRHGSNKFDWEDYRSKLKEEQNRLMLDDAPQVFSLFAKYDKLGNLMAS